MHETEAYTNISDHKDEFPNNICRLINPPKSSVGKISKAIPGTINKNAIRSTYINHCKRIFYVLDWISELFHSLVQFVKEVTAVSDNDIHIIMQSRKTLLFNVNIVGNKVKQWRFWSANRMLQWSRGLWDSRILPME